MKPYYEDSKSGIVIYHGDAMEVLPSLGRYDHMITDPPYSAHTHQKQWIGAALTANGKPRVGTKFKELGFESLTEELRGCLLSFLSTQVVRWGLFFSDVESAHLWRDAIGAIGLDCVRTCFWDKVDSAPQFTGDRPAAAVEAIVLAHKPGRKQWNGGGRRNLFRHAVNGRNQGPKPHPSTKPIALMTELVSLFTDQGESVIDPCAGSGTTLVACKELGRKATGIEVIEEHCESCASRLSQEVLQLA